MNIFKRIFGKKEKKLGKITFGPRDENGFADTFVDGKKTNLRTMLWDYEDVKKLWGIIENKDFQE